MRRDLGLVALGVGSALAYLLIARLAGASGFPLDDAWIHQTYARNLGWHAQWAYVLGQPSGGSTSPLWTMLLALGYALRIDYIVWTNGWNILLLGGLAWLTYKVSGQWWAGALAALEWHLAWAAASGMETILFCVLILAAWWVIQPKGASFYICGLGGVLIGLAVWTRPDGLTLVPFSCLATWSVNGSRKLRLLRLGWLVGGLTVMLVPYFLFNLALSGQFWPNTYFAKQAEYAILRQWPLWQRLAQIYSAPLVGGLLLLLPGLWLGLTGRLVPVAWALTFLLTYALRLPVTYQHARYLIPVLPVLIAVGAAGMAGWVQLQSKVTWRRIVSRSWVLGLGAVTFAFWMAGVNALVNDNRFINSEMVATAKWVAANVPPNSLVAAHDIGALGYFAEIRLVDMAGLVSPAIIPALGNDAQVWDFVHQSGAQYVITYPGWCPQFIQAPDVKPIFTTGPSCTSTNPADKHMTVYIVLR